MSADNYGRFYWCAKTAAGEKIYFHADRVEVTVTGDLIGTAEKTDKRDREFPTFSLAKGAWLYFYAASVIDGGAVAVEHWDQPPTAPADTASASIKNKPKYPPVPQGTIYFVEAEGLGRIKIGFTDKTVEERMRALSTGCPAPLTVLGTRKGTRSDERELHARFWSERISGEWFRACPEIRAAASPAETAEAFLQRIKPQVTNS